MILDILSWDVSLFRFINSDLSNPLFDLILPLIRNKYTWIPLYVFLISFILFNLKKNALLLVLMVFLCVGISDILSSHLIKKTVKRERPCQADGLKDEVQLLIRCGGGYSFTSSHATNHFSIATILFFTLGGLLKRWRWLLFIWAAMISFSQVYVGVHYPLDILAGGIIGFCLGAVMAEVYFKLTEN